MKNIPEIRIKGFEGEWKEKLIGDISDSFSGGTPNAHEPSYYGGKIPFIRSGEIGSNKTELFLTDKGYQNSSAKIVEKGTLLYALYGATSGEVAISNINGAINQAILAIYPHKGYDSVFMHYWLKANKKDIISTYLQGGQGNLSGELVKSIKILFPNLAEQQSLGSFFSSFDRLLSDHHRRLENLRRVKKSMLQKMFPQQGQTVPEIRFKGFSGEWEKAKLSTFLEVSEEKNSDNFYGIEDVLSVSGDYGVVNQIEFQGRSFAGASVAGYGVAETGDVIYTKSPLKSNPYGIIKTNKGKPGIVSVLYGVYHPIKGRTDSSFVQTYFESDARLNNYLRVLINKGSKNTLLISDEDALRGEVCFPSYEEQQRLSSFFTSLDNLINDEVNCIDQLTRVKSTLLQKMFV